MGITYGDHLIDSGYHDITPEQEHEIELQCPLCGGDCSSANPPVWDCPMRSETSKERSVRRVQTSAKPAEKIIPMPFDFEKDYQELATYRTAWGGDYDGTACPNCSRIRMMLCRNGRRRCEKCNWDPEAKAYSEYGGEA